MSSRERPPGPRDGSSSPAPVAPPDADGTRCVHAGLAEAVAGQPFLAGPQLASAFHLPGDPHRASYTYHRYGNPTWSAYERALSELEGGDAVVLPSGMAAVSALVSGLGGGDVLVAPADAYPGIRELGAGELESRGVEVRLVASDTEAVLGALPAATLVWVETPSNPSLDVVDLVAVARATHAAGARLAVDNTLATPLGQRPLALGADFSMASASKQLTGHSDLVLGYVAVGDPAEADGIRDWRARTGSIPGPFEVWLAHRSLATLDLRVTRQGANALALAHRLAGRDGVSDVRYPGRPQDLSHPLAATQMAHFGSLVGFTLPTAQAAERFLSECRLIAQATSFGGVHSTAERRGRWGSDAVAEGFIRLSAGIENTNDLLADVEQALAVALDAAPHPLS